MTYNELFQITDNGDNTYTFNSTGMPEHEIDNNVNPNAATEQNYEIQISSTPTTGKYWLYAKLKR